jgi:RecJ-like exonuclease
MNRATLIDRVQEANHYAAGMTRGEAGQVVDAVAPLVGEIIAERIAHLPGVAGLPDSVSRHRAMQAARQGLN